jgi:PAS domain S-box-containing protein
MKFAEDIGADRQGTTLDIHSNDEIGLLAGGLNKMSQSLQRSRFEIERAEQLYRGIFENAMEGIFQADRDFRILIGNSALARILGYSSPAEMLGLHLTDHFADRGQQEMLHHRLLAEGSVINFEVSTVCRDGAPGSCSLHVHAQREGHAETWLLHGILTDTTERRKVETERRRAAEEENRLLQSELETLRYQNRRSK